MTTYTPPDYSAGVGIPSQSSDIIGLTAEGFISGDSPAILTEDLLFAASQNIPARTPVGFDGSGNLIPAVLGTTAAIGLTLINVVTPASPLKGAPVLRGGCFDPALINWDATYNTDAKKAAAFRAAPTPTNIIIRGRKTGTVVLP